MSVLTLILYYINNIETNIISLLMVLFFVIYTNKDIVLLIKKMDLKNIVLKKIK